MTKPIIFALLFAMTACGDASSPAPERTRCDLVCSPDGTACACKPDGGFPAPPDGGNEMFNPTPPDGGASDD